MGFFSGPEEDARRRKLTDMENKRLAFAGEMARVGFVPERMLLLSTERGNLLGICRDGGALCLIVGPELGAEDDFVLWRLERSRVRREEVIEPATGLGGALGFGTKGAFGFVCTICADEGEFALPVVAHRGGALLCDSNGKTFFESASHGEVKNTVGAGDSMVAGFIAGYTKGLSLPDALRLGSAAGSATAFSEGLGDKETIEKLLLEKQKNNSSGGI